MATKPRSLGVQVQMWKAKVKRYLAEHGGQRIEGIADTTRERVVKILRSAVQKGQNPREAAYAVREAMQGISRARAERIARTEVVGASNAGRDLMAEQVGVPMLKTWIATPDERTRLHHAQADGQTVPRHKPFVVNGERLRWPGDTSLGASPGNVVNCRCTVGYEVDESGEDYRAQYVEQVMERLQSEGFSIRPGDYMGIRAPTRGYMVASKVQGLIIPLDVMSLEEIQVLVEDWVKATWKHIRNRPNYYYGGWMEVIEHNGVKRPFFFLDVSVNVMDRKLAIRWGKGRDQIGVWDVRRKVSIPTGGKGHMDELLQSFFGKIPQARRPGPLEHLGIDYSKVGQEGYPTPYNVALNYTNHPVTQNWREIERLRQRQEKAVQRAWTPSKRQATSWLDLFEFVQKPEEVPEIAEYLQWAREGFGLLDSLIKAPKINASRKLRYAIADSDWLKEKKLIPAISGAGAVQVSWDEKGEFTPYNAYGVMQFIDRDRKRLRIEFIANIFHEIGGHMLDFILSPTPGKTMSSGAGSKGKDRYTESQISAMGDLAKFVEKVASNPSRLRSFDRSYDLSSRSYYWLRPTEIMARAVEQWAAGYITDPKLRQGYLGHLKRREKIFGSKYVHLTANELLEFDSVFKKLLQEFGLEGDAFKVTKVLEASNPALDKDGKPKYEPFRHWGVTYDPRKREASNVFGVDYRDFTIGETVREYDKALEARNKAFDPSRKEKGAWSILFQYPQHGEVDDPVAERTLDIVASTLISLDRIIRPPKPLDGSRLKVFVQDGDLLTAKMGQLAGGGGYMLPYSITHDKQAPLNAFGFVVYARPSEPMRFFTTPTTVVHEVGHILDCILSVPGKALTENPFGRLLGAGIKWEDIENNPKELTGLGYTAEQIRAIKKLYFTIYKLQASPERRKIFEKAGIDENMVYSYFLQPMEMLARGFEQWIAYKTNDKMLRYQLKETIRLKKISGVGGAYLTADELREFDRAMDAIVQAFGLAGPDYYRKSQAASTVEAGEAGKKPSKPKPKPPETYKKWGLTYSITKSDYENLYGIKPDWERGNDYLTYLDVRLKAYDPTKIEATPWAGMFDMPQLGKVKDKTFNSVNKVVQQGLGLLDKVVQAPKPLDGSRLKLFIEDRDFLEKNGLPNRTNMGWNAASHVGFRPPAPLKSYGISVVAKTEGGIRKGEILDALWHEIGHVLDGMLMGDPKQAVSTDGSPGLYGSQFAYTEEQRKAMLAVYGIIYKATESGSRVKEIQKAGLSRDYWLDRKEIFARAFSQWVMKRLAAADKKLKGELDLYLEIRATQVGTNKIFLTARELKEFDAAMQALIEAFNIKGGKS